MTTTISFHHDTAERTREGRFDLARDATLRLRTGGGALRLRADGGPLLVTREGDQDDHVLSAGDELRVSGPGLVVVWALDPARIDVSRDPVVHAHAA
jgi:DUF2917 family protein